MFLLSITESLRPGGLALNSVVSSLLPDLQTQCNMNQSSQQAILWWQRADSEMCMERQKSQGTKTYSLELILGMAKKSRVGTEATQAQGSL